MLRWSLERRLSLLYMLNVADWLCTAVLLRTGGFCEANPLMKPVAGDFLLGFFVKCVMPAVLLLFVRYLCGRLGVSELRSVDRFIAFAIALYTVLCLVHIVNFLLWFGAESVVKSCFLVLGLD